MSGAPLMFSPAQLATQVEIVENGWATIGDALRRKNVDKDIMAAYNSMQSAWYKAKEEDVTWPFNSAWEKVQHYKKEMYSFADQLRRKGIETFVMSEAVANRMSDDESKGFQLPWWGWAGVAAVAIYSIHPIKAAYAIRSFIPSHRKRSR